MFKISKVLSPLDLFHLNKATLSSSVEILFLFSLLPSKFSSIYFHRLDSCLFHSSLLTPIEPEALTSEYCVKLLYMQKHSCFVLAINHFLSRRRESVFRVEENACYNTGSCVFPSGVFNYSVQLVLYLWCWFIYLSKLLF